MYWAVIGDIIDSQKLKERGEVQEKLEQVLKQMNKRYADKLAAKFVITLGDEFQGLFTAPDAAIEATELIRQNMYPVRIRFGVGKGRITTKINPRAAIGADGPAYYRAREGIKLAKKSETQKCTPQKATYYVSDIDSTLTANVLLCLLGNIEENWTSRQREIISLLQNGFSQSQIAEKLNVCQSSICRCIEKSGYYRYVFALDFLKKHLVGACND